MKKVFCIGDMHLPFHNMEIVRKILAAIKREQPDVVIQMGDLYDMFSQTRFARTTKIMTPQDEMETGRAMAEELWEVIHEIVPNAELHQLMGNHDDRPYKRLLEKAAELEPFIDIKRMFQFENVTTHSSRNELIIDDVLYTHGHLSRLGDHMRYYLRSVVRAHDHLGGIVFCNIHDKTLYEMSVGYTADKDAVPMQYSPTRTVKWTWGYGVIDEHGPKFCPLL